MSENWQERAEKAERERDEALVEVVGDATLAAEIMALREALEPFAHYAGVPGPKEYGAARAALASTSESVQQIEAVLAAAEAQQMAGDEVRRVEAIVPRDAQVIMHAEADWVIAARATDEAVRARKGE